MKRLGLSAASAALLLAMSPPAHALVTDSFCGPSAGTGCEAASDQMIFLQKATDVTQGFGNVGGPSNSLPQITINSDGGLLQMFVDIANGFATIKPAQGQSTFNGIDVIAPTGFGFTDLVFDTQLTPTVSPTDSFTVTGRTNGVIDLPIGTRVDQADQDAEYSITAIGSPGTIGFFTDVNIQALTGFDEIKHLETSLCKIQSNGTCTPFVAVPEPASLVLLGSGLAGLGLAIRRRRQKNPNRLLQGT